MNGQKQNKCKNCGGDGYIICPVCHGDKKVRSGTNTSSKGTVETKTSCVRCGGKGTIPCATCKGTGVYPPV